MIDPESRLFEAVRRGGNRAPGSWIGIVAPIEPNEVLRDEIISEAQAQFDCQLKGIDVHAASPFQLAQDLQFRAADWLLLYGFDEWLPESWHSAELNRNAWIRKSGLNWFLLGPTAASNIARYAPNVRSLIGPYLVLSPDDSQMPEAERHSRLTQLREHYGKTDAEILTEAESQKLEMSPHMVEWLILLNRGDLV